MQPQLPQAATVLIVDDEADICRLLAFNLGAAGFSTRVVHSGQEALAALEVLRPAVLVLDIMLPDLSGTEVCRRVRSDPAQAELGIIMLTARGDEADRVIGLELGADDYVVKPFSVREVVLRVQAIARRSVERKLASSEPDSGRRLSWRGLEVDPVRHRVLADAAPLTLRPVEFKLIVLFLEHPGEVFSRNQVLDAIWGSDAVVNARTIDTHIRRLREALGVYGEAVETVHGFGYRLRDA